MANLNLSQFTEKTLVADADWVFVWDTAGAISKKVSRNSLLNSGTLTTSAPVTISQTWNASAVAFTALKVDATSTNSASGSLLLDLQVGGASVFKVSKAGEVTSNFISTFGVNALNLQYAATGVINAFTNFNLGVGNSLVFSDVFLQRDGAANTLALRNGTNAQTFNVYGTSSSSNTVYERMFARYDGTALAFQVGTQHVGASARPLQLLTDNTARMTIGTTGNVGIGTTAPTSGLHISGALGTDGGTYNSAAAIKLTNTTVNSSWLLTSGVVGVANAHFCIRRESVSPPALTIAGITDNVGIGTTAPAAKLHVVGNGLFGENATSATATPVKVSFGGTYGTSTPGSKANLKWDLYNDGALVSNTYGIGMSLGLMEFQTGTAGGFGFYPNASTTSALHIISSGNVGIGTTAPSSKLQVSAGDVEVDTIAKGVILKSPDGTRYRVTVANGGTLSVAAV